MAHSLPFKPVYVCTRAITDLGTLFRGVRPGTLDLALQAEGRGFEPIVSTIVSTGYSLGLAEPKSANPVGLGPFLSPATGFVYRMGL